jgi:hypothetical protein
MNKYIKVISMMLALSGSIYLPSAIASCNNTSTDMLITLAETYPDLIDRLNYLAVNDAELLTQLLKMSEADPVKVERLLGLAETNPTMFWVLANVYNAQAAQNSSEDDGMVSTCGTISDGGGIIH